MAPIRVDVWSDIACPWCYVGKRHLEAALEGFEGLVSVVYRAFELDPSAPVDADPDVTYVERLAKKYGTDAADAQAMIDRMVGVGAKVGLDLRFDRVRPTNTFDAHRLLAWARERGAAEQSELKERLCRAYLTEGLHIGDREVLAEIAEAAGLDRAQAAERLAGQAHSDEVRADELEARRLGISGVPFFVLGGRLGVSGAQPPEVLRGALEQLRAPA